MSGIDQDDVAGAYDAAADGWDAGAGRLYDRLATVLVDHLDVPAGARVLDLCAGTGAVGSALPAGTSLVAVDLSAAMLTRLARRLPQATTIVAAADALPVATGSVDLTTCAFGVNHVDDPVAVLAEAARACRPDGAIGCSVADPSAVVPHKATVDDVLAGAGYAPPAWHDRMKDEGEARVGTVAALITLAERAGLTSVAVHRDVVASHLDPTGVVAWRWSMASHAPFVSALDPATRDELFARTVDAVTATWAEVEVPMLVLCARA